jgi:hypothetical protein
MKLLLVNGNTTQTVTDRVVAEATRALRLALRLPASPRGSA